MSKIKTNQMYRSVAKLMKDIFRAKEVFIESNYNGQWHSQMIKYPEANYSSSQNTLSIITVDDFGDFCIRLKDLVCVDLMDNEDTFDCWLHFTNDRAVEISNEW